MIEYITYLLTTIIILSIIAQSYNLTLGYTGIVHLGQIGFQAIGAYTSAILTIHGVPFLIALFIATIFGGIAGFLIGLPSIRLRADYLTITTLGFGEIIRLIAINWVDLTNGPLGITGIPKPEIFGIKFISLTSIFILYLIIGVIVHAIFYKIIHSPYGKVIESIKEDEIAAKSLGINTNMIKLQVLTISAAAAALSGSLLAHMFNYIDPTMFKINEMATILIITIVGGLGNFWGAIAGAFAINIIFEPLRFLPFPIGVIGAIRRTAYAVIFIAIILFRPQGVIGKNKYFQKKS